MAGRPYWGTRPSQKAIKRIKRDIHDATSSRWNATSAASRVEELNPLLRGWAGYFNQGPVSKIYRNLQDYTARRLRIWLRRKRGKKGTGYRQYSNEYLYETLGLYRLPLTRSEPGKTMGENAAVQILSKVRPTARPPGGGCGRERKDRARPRAQASENA